VKTRLFVFLPKDLLAVEATDELEFVLGAKEFLLEFLEQGQLIPSVHDGHLYYLKMNLKFLQELFVSVLPLMAFQNKDRILKVFEDVFESFFTIFNLVYLPENVHVIRLVEVKEYINHSHDNPVSAQVMN